MTKYVFVTGGVVSSLGKGIAAASLAAILESRSIRVTNIKLDPYINVDPGTMSPFQHGEVFVTEDGAETDLDLGHYERFTDTNTSRASNATAGALYNSVIRPAPRGASPGGTVMGRSEEELSTDIREKIALFANLPVSSVVSARDVDSIYKVPLEFAREGVDEVVLKHFGIELPPPDLADWEGLC